MLKVLELRKLRGWTQQKLSEETGVSRNYISEIERNSHSVTVDILCRLCKGFGVTPNDLIEEKYWRK
ncbi:helix-turn-helix domain-containing protein [Clostridium thermarum]|uniref:helix-turn-helix domain-containing protein n=1 Tax=Clostridium thermarum TaxID=1716543 RepID=UPI0013CF6009|nr:helix-turn-helix transcriptional regulator [Clostridium thermarum]